MTPRGSICSVVSTGLQNFVYNADYESDEEKDEDEVSSETISTKSKNVKKTKINTLKLP